jgi:hypothetical protein
MYVLFFLYLIRILPISSFLVIHKCILFVDYLTTLQAYQIILCKIMDNGLDRT